MPKLFLVNNTIYLPIKKELTDTSQQKYVKGSICGTISNQSYTEEEIKKKHILSKIHKVDNLNQLTRVWERTV